MISDSLNQGSVLGLDIGSVSLSIVQTDLSGKILKDAYVFHKGQVRDTILSLEKNFDLTNLYGISSTTSRDLSPDIIHVFKPQIAIIYAARRFYKKFGSILLVGAEKFILLNFDQHGNFTHSKSNSSCAAGTGSFLDQQANRLNLSGIEELCSIAGQNNGEIPEIASRCAVFAKTDLIHAQQQGFSTEAICDSLCKGLAKNIVDTLFCGRKPNQPILFIGGVSKNKPVTRYLEELTGMKLVRHQHSHIFGSLGACFQLLEKKAISSPLRLNSLNAIFSRKSSCIYFHEPLTLTHSEYPDITGEVSYKFKPRNSSHTDDVQVDFYTKLAENILYKTYLGIDIGSTSTKAIILNNDLTPVAGFYTYTAGKPVNALMAIFEATNEIIQKKNINLEFLGVGTTGSGRKFIGKIIGADIVIDEITTHARAACELNPKVDTIIEIGGQDSKFTLLRNGMVFFSQMNAVCAAGTGSFIEEQAEKLGCPLSEYSEKAMDVRAPLASDRCTVFMERDTNYLLNQGYSVNEILATTLHSVRENYLKKVAIEGAIGENICFQGATAKNKSLVAAFEQKLKKKIFVSKYCHLTGALGITLMLSDERISKTGFRGLSLYNKPIPIEIETCPYCNNHCRITIAKINNKKITYGFLCGRYYNT